MFYDYFYYSKVNGCSTNDSSDKNCICWHKEGTGPNKHVKAMQDLTVAFVFDSEKKIKLTWKKKINKKLIIQLSAIVSLLFLNGLLVFL